MEASVDIDLVAHFGFFRNVDLLQRGIYCVQVNLKCGSQQTSVAPVGIFSSSSTLDSFVGDLRISSHGLIAPCEVDDAKHSFRSRAFLILYRDEKYELNEGVHWRLTFSRLPIKSSANAEPICCPELLHIKFELLFCELTSSASGVPHDKIGSLIPRKPQFETIATQNIVIQKASSDLHQYFPITFANPHCTELDVMFHSCITGIRFDHFCIPTEECHAAESNSRPAERLHDDASEQEGASKLYAEEEKKLELQDTGPMSPTGSDRTESFRSFGGSSWRSDSYSRANSSNMQVDASGFLRGGITTKHNVVFRQNTTETESSASGDEVDEDSLFNSMRESGDEKKVLTQVFGNEYTERRIRATTRDSIDTPQDLPIPEPSFDGPPIPPLSVQTAENSPSLPPPPPSSTSSSSASSTVHNNTPMEPGYQRSAQRRATTLIASKASGNAAEAPTPKNRPLVQSILNLVSPNRSSASTSPTFGSNSVSSSPMPSSGPSTGASGTRQTPRRSFLSRFKKDPSDKDRKNDSSDGMPVVAHHTGKHSRPTPTRPSKILSSEGSNAHEGTGTSDDNHGGPAEDEGLPFSPPQSKESLLLSADQIDRLYRQYSNPVIRNFRLTIQSTRAILAQYHEQNALDNSANTRTAAALLQSQLNEECILEEQAEDLLEELKKTQNFHDVEKQFRKHIDTCSIQLSLRWSVILVAMRRMLHVILNQLKEEYGVNIRTFWKQQLMICTRSLENLESRLWNRDTTALNALQNLMDAERTHDRLVISGQHSALPARHLSVFDADLHMIPSRLPYIYLEQSVSDSSHGGYLFDELFGRLNVAHRPQRQSQGRYVKQIVILVHGFLGCEADMWLLCQALRLYNDAQDHVQVFIPKSNEHCPTESISTMAANLADELCSYLQEHAPRALDPHAQGDERSSFGWYEYKLSFFAHSMGGVIVRLALQDPRLQALADKLHLFVSLASPHLGTLYMSSSLVSAGMWALSTFKQYKSLKELNMEDDAAAGDLTNSLLFQLSRAKEDQVDLLGCFHKVILVSAPEDQYVPSYSASIEVPPSIASDGKSGQAIAKMAEQLLERLQPERLVRLTVFNLHSNSSSNHIQAYTSGAASASSAQTPTQSNAHSSAMAESIVSNLATPHKKQGFLDINDAIGRTAHICYLENQQFSKQLVFTVLPYFYDV